MGSVFFMKRFLPLFAICLMLGTDAARAQNNSADAAEAANRDRFDRTMVRGLSAKLNRSRALCTAAKDNSDANAESWCAKQAKDEESLRSFCEIVLSRGGNWAALPCNAALETNP
jgi:hypothetical protein